MLSATEMKTAHQTQEKFDFYLLSLVFTLLALSVQTAVFDEYLPSIVFELTGWASLLISGLVGLWRIEYLPVERVKLVKLDELRESIYEAKRLILGGTNEIHVASTGESQTLEERINNLEEAVELLVPLTKTLENRNLLKYKIHKLSFVVGIVTLVVGRGIQPFTAAVNQLLVCT